VADRDGILEEVAPEARSLSKQPSRDEAMEHLVGGRSCLRRIESPLIG
jgi:hypothetical protein